MAYNLPDAWDPGYVLPDNVVDEGLERQAFVTKQMPRGSYDNPAVGNNGTGYTVPSYVDDEGYGQGTYTTKWQPSGSYNGPKVPHWLNQRPQVVRSQPLPGGGRAVTIQPLGDDPLPEPFETYGQQAAAGLIARVSVLPAGQRQVVLKGILDQVDKSLWSRTNDIFQRYVKQGMNPAQAFPMALARAMSTGIAAEIINTGLRGTAPQAKSLLGLGCYGCAAVLGAFDWSTVTGGPILSGGGGGTPAVSNPNALPPPGACYVAPGFTWVAATPSMPGHWERPQAGQVAQPYCPNGPPPAGTPTVTLAPSTRDQRPQYDFYVGPFGFNAAGLTRVWGVGSTPSTTVSNRAAPPDITYLTPDVNAGVPGLTSTSAVRPITPDVLAWLQARLTEAKDPNGMTDNPVHYTDASATYGFPESDAPAWFAAMGVQPDTPVRMHALSDMRTTIAPLIRTKNPKTGENMVMHVQLARSNPLVDWNATTNPLVLKVWLSRVPDPSVWGALWNPMILINPLTALQALASVTAGATNYLSGLACNILTDPQGKAVASAGAGAVAAAYGVPPQAGAAGVQVAANACGKPPPPPPPIIPHHSILPIVLLAGGAVLAAAILTRPKKKAASP